MKRLLLTLVFLFSIIQLAFPQPPDKIKFQAVARTSSGGIISTQADIRLSILEGSVTGSAVHTFNETVTPNNMGVFNVTMTGMGGINWGANDYFLKVEINYSGTYEQLGDPKQIMSVPYALYAETAKDVNDADADPTNEFQLLSLSGSDLSISDGNVISLSSLASPWVNNSYGLDYTSGNVGIGINMPLNKLSVVTDESSAGNGIIFGNYTGTTSIDGIGVRGLSVPVDYYGIGGSFTGGWKGAEGFVFPEGDDYYYGVYGYTDGGTGTNHGLFGAAYGSGVNYGVYGSASGGTTNWAGYFSGDLYSSGDLTVNDDLFLADYLQVGGSSGDRLTFSGAVLRTYGEAGSQNAGLGWPIIGGTNYPDHGYINVRDAGGTIEAGMYVNTAGNGVIFADEKNFRMDHPEDPTKEIWYACIEGPEAAAYERGTATLNNGETTVDFSEHFRLLANTNTLTVILTPLSGDSKGLAVIEKGENGFKVKELHNGTGNYQFDWEVKAVRNGYEDYQAVREKANFPQDLQSAGQNRVEPQIDIQKELPKKRLKNQ